MTLDELLPRLSKKRREDMEALVKELEQKCIAIKVGLEKQTIARERAQGILAGHQRDLAILKQQLQAP